MQSNLHPTLRPGQESAPSFDKMLSRYGFGYLTRAKTVTLQVNVGKLCNQACHHCHVDAGPARIERMEYATAERVLELLARSPDVRTLDVPVAALLGGRYGADFPLYRAISQDAPEAMAERVDQLGAISRQ